MEAHYSKPKVQQEIAKFSNKRWVGIHCSLKTRDGRPILLRYDGEKPLTISDGSDVQKMLKRFGRLRPRAIYATANLYSRLTDRSDVTSLKNVIACMPTWDIDNTIENWRATLEAARQIHAFLQKKGVKSAILKWSGKGMHVHIHQASISPKFRRKIHPFDAAYAIVEYTNRTLESGFEEIRSRMNAKQLRVDNEMDQQRLFTAPLSLHRELDIVAVVINPDELESFDPSFADPMNFRHFYRWNNIRLGEADNLAKEAIESVGVSPWNGLHWTSRKAQR